MLLQEAAYWNRVLGRVRAGCGAVVAAVAGAHVATAALDRTAAALRDGRVPVTWLPDSEPVCS